MRLLRTPPSVLVALLCLASPAAAAPAPAPAAVGIVVLREHAVGSTSQAQQYLDALAAAAARVNGWGSATGKYHADRAGARADIDARKPSYGILSLGAFLGLRKAYGLQVVGQATVTGAGGEQYFLVGKTAGDLAGCKGKRVASNHADDRSFVEKVVGAGAFAWSDFQWVQTRRPLQTVKAVIRGEADCALIDDAQKADLANVEGGRELKVAWSSKRQPPLVVVAFSWAPPAEVKKFKDSLAKICQGEGLKACKDTGLKALRPSTDAPYRDAIAAYGG